MVELVRQIGTGCEERGALLDKARERLFHALAWADRAMGWMMQVRGYQQVCGCDGSPANGRREGGGAMHTTPVLG